MTPLENKKILVIEDEAKLAKLIQSWLELKGVEAHVAFSGAEGLQLTDTLKPDLIVLDVILPDSNGLEICQEIRQRYRTNPIPILFLTALGEPIDKFRGIQSGADAYITKPYEQDDLYETIQRLLSGEHPLLDETPPLIN